MEADTDFSGFITIDELYEIIKGMGANVTEEDVIGLMSEADQDKNGKLDIDEFVNIFTMGNQIKNLS